MGTFSCPPSPGTSPTYSPDPPKRHPPRHPVSPSVTRHVTLVSPSVTLVSPSVTRHVSLPDQALVLPRRPQPSRSAFRGASSVGDQRSARSSPHLPSSASRSRCARSPDRRIRCGQSAPMRLMSGYAGRRAPHPTSIAGRTQAWRHESRPRSPEGSASGQRCPGIGPGHRCCPESDHGASSRGSRPRLVTFTSEPRDDRDSREWQWRSERASSPL